MADVLTIPVAPSVPFQTQVTTLDGRPFRLSFRWNGRIERWFVSVETAAGVPIVASKALVLGADVLRQVRYRPDAPPGVLTVADTAGADVEAGFATLGGRHRVLYFAVGE